MNDAPISVSIIVFATYIIAFLIGGIFMAMFANIGFLGVLALALAAFIPVPLNGVVRQILGRAMAQVEGSQAQPPVAASYLVRMVIGAICALLAAYLITLAQIGNGFLAGGLAAALTSICITVIFASIVSLRRSRARN